MNQITLNNGTTLEVVQVNGQTKYFQGANRDTLEFQFAKESTTFDNLDTLFANSDNTSKITIKNGADEFLNENYSLRVSMNLSAIVIAPATDTDPEVTEERYTVTMAQKTYAEMQLEATAASTMTALEGIAEIYETLILGGVI